MKAKTLEKDKMKWYIKRRDRRNAEIAAIKTVYPKARILLNRGRLVVFLKVIGRKATYLVKVVYPDDFPYEQPDAYVVEPRIKNAPHRWRNGSLCFHEDGQGPQTSGKIILDLSRKWIEAYEHWVDTDRWPKRIR